MNLVIKNESPLQRWTNEISVMLEKKPGVVRVDKLRAILLLEADFNGINKIIFNTKLIPSIEHSQSIPREIIGGRRAQLAIQLTVNKKLISDITNQ